MHPLNFPAGLLDRQHIGAIGRQAGNYGDRDLNAATTRDAVKHDRNGDGLGDLLEMSIETLGRGLVIIGGNHQGGIGPQSLGLDRQFDSLGGRIGTGARNDQCSLISHFDGDFDDAAVFLVSQGGGFTGRADGNETGNTTLDLGLYEGAQ